MQQTLHEIIRAVKNGDKEAFRKLVEEFRHGAFRLAFRMLGDEEDARDVVQESFIKMWQKINSYKETEKFTGWMYRIVSNTAIDRMRAVKRHPRVSIDDIQGRLVLLTDDSDHRRLENKEAGELIRMMTEDLPEKQRIIFSLRELEGLSSEEVEAVTGFSEDIVKSNLYHARKAIRERLEAIFNYERRDA